MTETKDKTIKNIGVSIDMERRLEFAGENDGIDYLYELVYRICEEFKVGSDFEIMNGYLLRAIDIGYYCLDRAEDYYDISKRLKILSFGIHSSYAYRTKNVEPLDILFLEGIYIDDEKEAVVENIGFLDAPDKCMEEELIESFEIAARVKNKLAKELWWDLYGCLSFEYNISVGAETPGDEWVKGWNNFGGVK